MADSDKDILITPNVSQTSQPEIKLVGKDNSPMYLKVLDDNTLSFEGTEGQVFSIGPTMSSGDIFSVSDISGVQSVAVNADGTITMNAQTKSTTIKNSASNTSTLILSNNNADAVDGPILEFFRDSASPADNDHMGSLVFTGRDDAGNKQEYGRITMHNDDATAASNGGELVFKLTEANSDEQEYMRLRASSRQIEFNTQSDDIDLTYNTDATNDFFYINAGTQRIGVGDAGTAPDHLLHLEGIDGGNGELFVERASGAGIKTQAQASTGVFGTSTNHTLALMTNGSQRVKINNVGGIEAVSNANGWNLWHKLTFGVLDYGTATGQGNGLKLLTFDDNEAGLPKYALPRDITIRAVVFHTNGVVLSGSDAQVLRIFANGDAGTGTLTNISYNASQFTRQNSENANATDHYLVVTGVDASYSAGDTLACRRESGAVDMGDYIVHIWYSIDNA
jgi:hypothetical protein